MFAEVIMNSNAKALNRIFDYIVPENLENEIKVGARVIVPFGKGGKLEDGFVIHLKESSEFANREICQMNKNESLTQENITLAKLMARKYFCNLSDCIKLMLPPGTGGKNAQTRAKEKMGRFVFLKKSKPEIDFLIQTGKLKSEKHKKVVEFLSKNDGVYVPDLQQLLEISQSVLKTMEKNEWIEIVEKTIERNPFVNQKVERDKPRNLTDEQKYCFYGIAEDIEFCNFSKNLIFGVTGSGKTEIYLQLIQKVLEKRKNSDCFSTRNFTNPPNGGTIFSTFW